MFYSGHAINYLQDSSNRIDESSKNITVLGLDFRHYIKIHRNLVWANRLAASTSSGTQKLVYYLGSVAIRLILVLLQLLILMYLLHLVRIMLIKHWLPT